MTNRKLDDILKEQYPQDGSVPAGYVPVKRAPWAECICACGHHYDEHFDGWGTCEGNDHDCECGGYEGSWPEPDPEASARFLALIRKDPA